MTYKAVTEMIKIYKLKRKHVSKKELAEGRRLIRKAIFQLRIARMMKTNRYGMAA